MIYIAKTDTNENQFLNLLEKTSKQLLAFWNGKNIISPEEFEKSVFEKLCNSTKATQFEGTVKRTGKYDFPDIIANKYFGVEVKMTNKNHWTSIGNSVNEPSFFDKIPQPDL